jgi:hypothetical protein
MKLVDIQPAIQAIAANPVVTELRGHTYLATYPCIIAIGTSSGLADAQRFYQLAAMIYGWMPRVLRIDPEFTLQAIAAFGEAQTASSGNFHQVPIQNIKNCLHSVVGASKLLHFVNPNVFPIWDSNIAKFLGISKSNVESVAKYIDYVHEVNNIRGEKEFSEFFINFSAQYSARLFASGIKPYPITEVRAVESAAFELSP